MLQYVWSHAGSESVDLTEPDGLLPEKDGDAMSKTTFTLAEAAALLNCHTETLRRAIHDGFLQAARLGREYRLSRSDLQAFWTVRGGGQLFAPHPPEQGKDPADTEHEVQEDGQSPAKSRPPGEKPGKEDPPSPVRQLSLIAPQGRTP